MDKDLKFFNKISETKNLRQSGKFKKSQNNNKQLDQSTVYDWVVDIDLVKNISRDGWKVTLSDQFYQKQQDMFKQR